jgi:hypothetical protein
MIERRAFVARVVGLAAFGLSGRVWGQGLGAAMKTSPITVYKSSSCGCCAKWVDHVRANGFVPAVHDHEDMETLKDELGVPKGVRSCHTAIADGYLIEGHVPASDIKRLLAERPKAAGLAVPEMPPLTPGMAPAGVKPRDFTVLAFQSDGATRVFARY